MAVLTIYRDGKKRHFAFEGEMTVAAALYSAGIFYAHPCGGRGVCGKCAIEIEGDTSAPDPTELRLGHRLACRTMLYGDATVRLPDTEVIQIVTDGFDNITPISSLSGTIGAAIDIGTTTVAGKLFDLGTGALLSSATCTNPQTAVAADVMGRIEAAENGREAELRLPLTDAISALLDRLCERSGGRPVRRLVITGNTTMLYLLTGRSPASLSRAPFAADCLFGFEETVLSRRVYLPHCIHAFVGADTTCAILASGMLDKEETALLCDVGTNGEIVLLCNGKLYVTSTAAGPAFEGAGITCGCGSISGAIDRVRIENGQPVIHTINDAQPTGLCGSGLIDAIAEFLRTGAIDETGAAESETLALTEKIFLTRKDIRAVQLAKAAIFAGINTLLHSAGIRAEDISTFYVAGGFGTHLNIDSAAQIGLLPKELCGKAKLIGNAALSGAAILLDRTAIPRSAKIAERATHIDLGGNPEFSSRFIEAMLFPEQ